MNQHEPTSHPTRRTIVRTAGHAVWAAPVVIAASAAPAFAASQINLDVVDFSRTGQSTEGATHTVRFKVRNNGVAIPSGTSITLQFEVAPTAGQAQYENYLGTNWTPGPTVPNLDLGFSKSFTYAGGLGAGSTSFELIVLYEVTGVLGSSREGSVSAVVTSPSAGLNDPGSATYP